MENPAERESVNELRDRVFEAASEHDRECIEEYVDGVIAIGKLDAAREMLEDIERRPIPDRGPDGVALRG
ncbi:hypothetical protein USB125703_00828 [Pseudoclavibacter triregionum]|nr:hypothetical protein USB125703_00828 [Pseudoclavibacter triregionum]